jgi:energy-coupling factor transporter ATP-binding protein EcfA2
VLVELRLKNFRGFEDHTVPVRPTTLIVGRNNAGKSSLVEALRLLSLITRRFRTVVYHPAPSWGNIPRREYGIRPSLTGLEINFSTLFHRYGEPPALIEATFDNQTGIRIYIGGQDKIHAVVLNANGSIIKDKSAAMRLDLPTVEILPQIGPLEENETVLSSDYVRSAVSSHLASKHFRNQLRVFSEQVPRFRMMVEETWPGLRILDLDSGRGYPNDSISLTVRDEDFAAEVAAMGHGLQMWVQTIWFLARVDADACVILDEPDVYMHPDLQRRLIRYLKRSHQQVVVATHSIEMMSEVTPDEILIVDRRRKNSRFATGAPVVQRLVEHVGSVHNIQLARLWNARKCLLVEGDDVSLLSIVHRLLFPEREPLETIPNLPVGGWGGWAYAIGSSLLLKNSGGETIAIYCILDSDYHSREAIQKRYDEAHNKGVRLHIWSHKELENYFLLPDPIVRAIRRRMPARTAEPPAEEIGTALDEICEKLKDDVFDAISAEILGENRALGSGGANKRAREILVERWQSRERRLAAVSGKQAFSRLSEWSQRQFGVSLSAATIAREMHGSEVQEEMRTVIEAIEYGTELDDYNDAK